MSDTDAPALNGDDLEPSADGAAELELIRDDAGIAVIGEPSAVERFLARHAPDAETRDLALNRLGSAAQAGAVAARAAGIVAEHSGRWVQLSAKSTDLLKQFPAMSGSAHGLSRAIVTNHGQIKGILEFTHNASTMLLNPAMLAGAAGIMSQLAMKQQMDAIADYLQVIDAKVVEVLGAQKNAALAEVIGAGLVIDEAMEIRERVGRVSETTWSKVQATSQSIATAQAYALLELERIAKQLEKEKNAGAVADLTRRAEKDVPEWLSVLARCFQLQDAIAVLELDRVLDAATSPDELDRHRDGLTASRRRRSALIARGTESLLARLGEVGHAANRRVLLHPIDSRAAVRSGNLVAAGIGDFHQTLGIESGGDALRAKEWLEAVAEARDGAVAAGAEGVAAAARLGADAFQSADQTVRGFADGLARRAEESRKRRDKTGG